MPNGKRSYTPGGRSFTEKDQNSIDMVKDFCFHHCKEQLDALQEKMIYSHSTYYEKEILLVNDDIEVMISGWLPALYMS
jgi:hypothetical protein